MQSTNKTQPIQGAPATSQGAELTKHGSGAGARSYGPPKASGGLAHCPPGYDGDATRTEWGKQHDSGNCDHLLDCCFELRANPKVKMQAWKIIGVDLESHTLRLQNGYEFKPGEEYCQLKNPKIGGYFGYDLTSSQVNSTRLYWAGDYFDNTYQAAKGGC